MVVGRWNEVIESQDISWCRRWYLQNYGKSALLEGALLVGVLFECVLFVCALLEGALLEGALREGVEIGWVCMTIWLDLALAPLQKMI